MSHWVAAEILLTAAVLALAMPREDGFVIPERRDWIGWAKGLLPRVRRSREAEAGREADRYLADLRDGPRPNPMVIRQSQLPSAVRRYEGLLTKPAEGQAQQRPPWTAAHPVFTPKPAPEPRPASMLQPFTFDDEPEPEPAPQEPPRHRRRAPGDPPTIVFEAVRPAIARDLRIYLGSLPTYDERPSGDAGSAGPLLAPHSPAGLGLPDHEGAPGDNHETDPEEDDLRPHQPGAVHVPVEDEHVGE